MFLIWVDITTTEFIYTGNLKVEKPLSSEDRMLLLRDLLELLTVADEWGLQELKVKAGKVIASEQKLVDPDTYNMGKCKVTFFTITRFKMIHMI